MNCIAICVITYNQENYIAQAIESMLMQDVSIPFTIFIGEDCSTDSTREICINYKDKYPDKIELVLYEQNQGLVKNTLFLLKKIWDAGYSYIAMLDGDDYWIDEHKLQKQYDFLENNEDYGLIHTNNELLWNDKDIEHKPKTNPLKGDVFHTIENFNVANCTVLFRASLLEYIDFIAFTDQGFMSCDYVMYAIFSKYAKFDFLDDFTAVWRRGHDSISNTNDINKDIAYIENGLRMWKYLDSLFSERFGYNEMSANEYKEYRRFNIAFRYKDFNLAQSILKSGNLGRRNLIFEIKKIAASNKLFFDLWIFLKKLLHFLSGKG